MLPSILRGRPRSRMPSRYTMLAAASVLAVGAGMAQAAPAEADYWGAITVVGAPGSPAAVLNAAGCGIPAQLVQWTFTTSQCSGGGSNERWDINANAVKYNQYGTAIWAHYDGHYMCMNVAGGVYRSGTPIIVWGCDRGATHNEIFYVDKSPAVGAFFWIYPAYQPAGANLCANVAGGFGNGHHIILYHCSVAYNNEDFWFGGW